MTRPKNPQLIEQIQNIVIKEVSRKGANNITMREIADRAGITPTTIYYYFENKDALFESIKFDIIDGLDRHLESSVDPKDPPKKRLIDIMRSFIRWNIENPNLSDLIFEVLPPQLELTEEKVKRYYKSTLRVIEIIDEAREAGELMNADAPMDTALGTAYMYGLAKLHRESRLAPEFWDNIGPMIDRMLDMFISFLETGGHE